MTLLDRKDLFHALFDALRQHTHAFYFAGGDNPYRFYYKGRYLSVFIGNIHFAKRTDPDEYRIQCPGDLPTKLNNDKQTGDTVLVFGFSADVKAFSAWDPDRFVDRNPRAQRFSIYTRLSSMRTALTRGLSAYIDTDAQNVINFRPDLIGLYVENASVLHQAADKELQELFEVHCETPLGQPLLRPVEVNRQRVTITSVAYPRSPQFRQMVLEGYAHTCAMCGIQLDLVDAAHIVPHAHPKGHNAVTNGLALCTLHHRSYDTGLLYIRRDYTIHLNDDRVKHLRKMGRANGLRRYARQLRNQLHLPTEDAWVPSPENLILGNELRGVGV